MIERIRVGEYGASFAQSQNTGATSTQSPDTSQSLDHPITQLPDVLQSPDHPITRFLTCYSDRPGGLLPGGPAAQFFDGSEMPKFGQSTEDVISGGPLRRHSRRSSSGTAASERRRLPQFVQALAEQMLAQGETAEEVAQAARECGFTRITAAKVNRWLGEDPVAHERIIRRQVKAVKDMQASITGAGASPDTLAADAALIGERTVSASAGASRSLDVRNLAAIQRSLRAQLQTENDSLKRRAKRLEARKAYLARRIEHAQMRLDRARLEVVQRRVGDLRDALQSGDAPRKEPDTSVFTEIVRSLCQLLKIGDRRD